MIKFLNSKSLKIKNSLKIENCKLKIIVLVILGLFGFWKVAGAQAQSLSLGIWPPLLEVMIQPGKSITQVYKISNPGEGDVVLTSLIAPFVPADEKGNTQLDASRSPLDASPWFSFQNADLALGQNFVLGAGHEQEVVLRIGVPANAREDDYYYTLLFETTAPNEAFGGVGNAQAQVKIGANILLTVSRSGEPHRQAQIKQFSLANFQLIDSFDRPEFLLRLQNTGQSFFKPMGTITVNGWFNQKFVLDLLPENVLTDSTRQISCQNGELATPCQLPGKFLLGKYTARAQLGLDEANAKYQKEIIFWAIPIKLMFGILTALILLVIIKKALKTNEIGRLSGGET